MLGSCLGPPGRVRVGARLRASGPADGNERTNAIASVTLGEVRAAIGTG